jgi:peroxiredoxin
MILWLPAFALAGTDPVQNQGDRSSPPDAKEILKKADEATKAVKAVSYDFDFRGQGDLADSFSRISGTVKAKHCRRNLLGRLLGISAGTPNIRVEARLQTPSSEKERAYTLATNGKRVYMIDEESCFFTYGDMPQAAPLLVRVRQLFMREFLHPTPFSDELNGRSAEYQGLQRPGNVECHVIYVVYANGSESRWFFGTQDYLPRRVDRIDKRWTGNAATVLTLTNLDTAPDLKNEDFLLSCPSGFNKRGFEGNWRPAPVKSKGSGLLGVGTRAPDWKLQSSSGKKVGLDSLRGNVVVMDFLATWCPSCNQAMPAVQNLHEQFKGRPVKILGLSCRAREDPAAYMKKKKLTYDLLIEADQVAKSYEVTALPTFYIIGPDGKIIHASAGFAPGEEKKMIKIIGKALEEGKRM